MKDSKLLELAAERERLKERAATLSRKADEIGRKIMADMQRRGIKALEGDGLRVNLVTPESTRIDAELLRTKLTPAKWRAVTTQVLDKRLLSEQVQAGRIPLATLNQVSSVVPGASYLRVSQPGG